MLNESFGLNWGTTVPEGQFHLETSVFPLLHIANGSSLTGMRGEYLGTCFLTLLAGNHVFVTARHLLESDPTKYNLYLGFCTPDDRVSIIKVRVIYVNSKVKDVSFFIPVAEMKTSYSGILSPMQVLRYPLPVGQSVLAYGFAGSKQELDSKGVPVMIINRTRFEGKVVAVDNYFPDAPSRSIYKLAFEAPRGLSGSPIMVIHEGQVKVAGFVLGEIESSDKSSAMAADFTPFIEIEKLIMDFSTKLPRDQAK
jgi:hypothetical protein